MNKEFTQDQKSKLLSLGFKEIITNIDDYKYLFYRDHGYPFVPPGDNPMSRHFRLCFYKQCVSKNNMFVFEGPTKTEIKGKFIPRQEIFHTFDGLINFLQGIKPIELEDI
jgi:hypothetical protein